MKPNRMTLTELTTETRLELGSDDGSGRRRFRMAAYTGAPVNYAGGRIVIDLAGMEISGKQKPIFRDHDRSKIAGYADSFETGGGRLLLSGSLCKSTEHAREIASLADEGFSWQASVGIDITEYERIDDEEMREVNGRSVPGPAVVITKSTLKESSFVPLGADSATSAVVFSDGNEFLLLSQHEETIMQDKIPESAVLADAENAGFKKGFDQCRAELKELLAAFPDRLAFALDQFLAGNGVEKSKAILSDQLKIELEAAIAAKLEAEKKAAAALATASPAPVQLDATATAPQVKPDASDPRAMAQWEWDNEKPQGFTTKERYVAIRVAELSGRFRRAASPK